MAVEQRVLTVNGERLRRTIESFADFGRTANNGVTRLSLTQEDIQARDYFAACCRELGMSVRCDDLGNMYATLEGAERKPPVMIGSHLDTVKKGGRFDGAFGVIAGLEIVRTLVDNGIRPRIPITVVNFTNEEGARFEPSMMASGILAGKFDGDAMMQSRDAEGVAFGEALEASGYRGDFRNRMADAAAFLELHIEQGPVLEEMGVSIGVVDCVVGMACYEIAVEGESNHAGTMPMGLRKDAFRAGHRLISSLYAELDALDRELVYTIGRVHAYPNIHTVIPNRFVFTIEARHKNEDVIRRVEQIIAGTTARRSDVSIRATKLWGRNTVWFQPELCERIKASADLLGYSNRRMVSGAGHDAQFVASLVPAAMIFVPSKGGKSHCEEEDTSYEQCEQGVNVLLQTVLSLL